MAHEIERNQLANIKVGKYSEYDFVGQIKNAVAATKASSLANFLRVLPREASILDC